MKRFLLKIKDSILELIYPHKCIICDEVINIGEEKWICKYCEFSINYIIDDFEPNISVLEYNEKIKDSIHRFKYNNCREYSYAFSLLMYNKFKKYCKLNYDIIVYVPMYYKKKKKRGYDQAELLAVEFSKITKIPLENNNLLRIKNTLPQSKVDFETRKINVENAFKIKNPDIFKNKNVILIDDIYTTGNTINQCYNELKKANVKNVCFLTLSKVKFNK